MGEGPESPELRRTRAGPAGFADGWNRATTNAVPFVCKRDTSEVASRGIFGTIHRSDAGITVAAR